jgi:hypothetical protein
METNFTAPMVEQIFKASNEAYVGRIVGERTYLQVLEKPATEWVSQHATLSKERDQVLGKSWKSMPQFTRPCERRSRPNRR